MLPDSGPVCLHHDPAIKMALRTLHSDRSSPEQLVGLFECPICGEERRMPLDLVAAGPEPHSRQSEVA